MLRWIVKTMVQGMVALIPIGLTVAIIAVLGVWLEGLLANPFKGLFPGSAEAYRMGMGIVSFLVLLFITGLMMKLWLVRKLLHWVEGSLMHLPLVKTIFGAIKDVMSFIGGDNKKKGDMVVMITLDNGWRQLGIVTRQDFHDLQSDLAAGNPDMLAVYVPFSYQLGGFTYFIDRKQCQPVSGMTVEDAMRYSLMAWLGSRESEQTSVRGTQPKS